MGGSTSRSSELKTASGFISVLPGDGVTRRKRDASLDVGELTPGDGGIEGNKKNPKRKTPQLLIYFSFKPIN